jgi:hypothetical protein
MPFQLRELAIPVVGESSQGGWPELGSTCRKGGSTCVAREPVMPEVTPQVSRRVELEMVRRQIRETVMAESAEDATLVIA